MIIVLNKDYQLKYKPRDTEFEFKLGRTDCVLISTEVIANVSLVV